MSRIYPVGGGKGGSGKSFITASLGVLFAKQGKKVVIVDLDLGGSNLHTFLGLKALETGLGDYLNRKIPRLDETAIQTAIPNLHIIGSINCSMEIANLYHAQKIKIIRAIQKLPYDYVLIDLGAGTNFNTLDFFLASNEGLFVLTPEPTSIENTFRFINAAYLRKIKQLLKQSDFGDSLKEIIDRSKTNAIKSPTDVIQWVTVLDSEKGERLKKKLNNLELSFVVNQSKADRRDSREKDRKGMQQAFPFPFSFPGKRQL